MSTYLSVCNLLSATKLHLGFYSNSLQGFFTESGSASMSFVKIGSATVTLS